MNTSMLGLFTIRLSRQLVELAPDFVGHRILQASCRGDEEEPLDSASRGYPPIDPTVEDAPVVSHRFTRGRRPLASGAQEQRLPVLCGYAPPSPTPAILAVKTAEGPSFDP